MLLRQAAVDEASQSLAARHRDETAATASVRGLAAEVTRQRLAVQAVEAGDAEVEAFGHWLRGARRKQQELVAAQQFAIAESARARAVLAAARAALEAVEILQAEQREAAAAAEARQEQRITDEAAARRAAGGPGWHRQG